MIDEKTDIALSKKIIFAGVQFNMENNYKGDFNRTNIKIFMDKYFSKDVVPSTIDELSIEEQRDSILTKKLTVQKKNRWFIFINIPYSNFLIEKGDVIFYIKLCKLNV